ncbi:unnamed protein product [Haemonchus placei]|uniref:Uncharacterized protein n=1 Tax=Haemonchus placei TaxID=6290 RepID=A0A0N4WDI3_HAEPC|nr:unnamed protein product [Haemonchus placei]
MMEWANAWEIPVICRNICTSYWESPHSAVHIQSSSTDLRRSP